MPTPEQEKTLAAPEYATLDSSQNDTKSNSKFCGWFGNCNAHMSCWLRKNTKKFLIAFAVILIIYLLFVLVVVEIEENNIAAESNMATYLQTLYHWKCKNRGCGSKCPHSDKSDPRVFVSEHTEYIGNLLDACRDHLSDEITQNAVDVKKYPTVAGELHETVVSQSKAVDDLFLLYLAAKTIDTEYSNCEVNNNTYTAQNHLAALSNAADVNKCKILLASLARASKVVNQELSSEEKQEKSKIHNFDKNYKKWSEAVTELLKMYNECVDSTKQGSLFENSQSLVLNSVKDGLVLGKSKETADQLANHVTVISNKKFDCLKSLETALRHMNTLKEFRVAFDKAHREGFNNDMPGSLNNAIANELIQNGDYGEAIIRTALEPDVVSKHKEFAASRANSTQTLVSKLSVRDDPNDVVPWVAYSRPTYTKADGVTSIDQSGIALKQIPSDNTNAIQAKRVRFMF